MNTHPVQTQSILIIEDSADDYEATMRALKKTNFHNPVNWCKSGQKALDFLTHRESGAKAGASLPGLILLDLNMPGLDGRKTLQLIKEHSVLRKIPVIVLTTSSDERDVNECYRIGANTYVQKPVSFDGLIEAVKRLKEYWFEIALLPKESGNE